MTFGVEADQHVLNQIFRLVRTQSESSETGPDQSSQEVGNILEQALVRCRVSLTFGAHGFGPELFAGIHVSLLRPRGTYRYVRLNLFCAPRCSITDP
jgi:hypothetical protein